MDRSGSLSVQESRFLEFWHTTLRPETPAGLVAHWRDYELSGVKRGYAVVDILRSLTDLVGVEVLDAGCGYGGVSIAFSLAGSQVVGIEADRERLRGAEIRARQDYQLPNISFECAALEHLPFTDSAFDVVLCVDVIENVRSQKMAIKSIARVLRPGGIAFVSLPNCLSPGNFLRDPHYELLGVSILPRPIAAWYVVEVRAASDNYGVGHLPIASVARYRFRKEGMEVVFQNPVLRRSLGPLTAIARAVRMNMYPQIQWVLRKTDEGRW